MIPVFTPYFGEEEKQYLNECIELGQVTANGDFVKKFEAHFAHFAKSKFAHTVSNGSAALETACHALSLGAG